MKFGLTESEHDFLMKNFVQPLKDRGARVFIFGSRATGRFQKFSDIDLLYKPATDLRNSDIYSLLMKLEESSFPFKIDLVKEEDLAQSYRDSVDRDKIEL